MKNVLIEKLKSLWPIRLNRKKKAVSGNESHVNPQSEGSNQLESTLVKLPDIDSKELGRSVQTTSQALKNVHTITGKPLEHEDKPGYYDRAEQSVLRRLSIFNDLVKNFADVHPYSKTAWSIISSVITIITDTQEMDQNILDLFETLDSTYKFIEESTEIQGHPSYQGILSSLAKQTQECAYFIQSYAKKQNFCTRVRMNIIGEPIRLRVKSYQDSFKKLLAEFRTHSALHTEISVSRLLESNNSIVENFDLDNLSYASNAGLNTGKQCLLGTRVEVLDEIEDWVNNNDDDCSRLFWLAGSAGMGKSAIAHSIASRFDSIKRLGSFFCFDKNSLERRDKIFSTIARDLASLDPQIKNELVKIIKSDYSLCHSTDLQRQWEKLISEPLRALSDISIGPILIVIDGLDESGDPISRRRLLTILEKEIPSLPGNIRFLITSRPEKDILLTFNKSQSRICSKMMNEIPERETNRDILSYLQTTLREEIEEEESFGDSHLKRLVELSQGLFQWAYLASEFLTGLGNRAGSTINDRYEDLITAQHIHIQSINDPLDAMYKKILSSLFDLKDSRVMSRFRSVIGSIVAASEPLSLNDLIALRGKDVSLSVRRTEIKAVIQYMGSLLSNIDNPSSPIRPLHLSFREYLLDHNRSHEFYIDPSPYHRDFAFGCLRTMMEELRFNICNMSSSYIRNTDDKGLSEKISSSIYSQLSYSSRHWAGHVFLTAFDTLLAERVEKFLDHGFLLWLEVLSLLQAVTGAAKSMSSIISWCSEKESYQTLHEFAVDGKRFVQLFGGAIADSAPHVYLSALPFCPQKSIIYKRFIRQYPNTLRIVSEPIHEWPLGWRRTTVKGVRSMCFSHGGQYLAVATSNARESVVTVFDPETLATLWIMPSPDKFNPDIWAVRFSTDDKSLVFVTKDNVHSFDILTGGRTKLLSDFSIANSIMISQDARFIALRLGRYPRPPVNLIVWNLCTREQIINVREEHRVIWDIFLNTDKTSYVTYHEWDIEVQIWDLETGVAQAFPIGPQLLDLFKKSGFPGFNPSSNAKQIVFTYDEDSYLWDYRDNSIITVKGRCLGATPGGDFVVTRVDNGILLHDKDGSQLHYPTTNDVEKFALSKDGKRLAVADEKHLDIVDLDGWQSDARRDNHSSNSITPLMRFKSVSSDGKYFLRNQTYKYSDICIWDVRLGQSIRKLPSRCLGRFSSIFSPTSRYLGYPSAEDTVNLYNIDSGINEELSFGDRSVHAQGIGFSQDETLMAILDVRQGTIYIWDIASSQIVDTLIIPSHVQPGGSVNFTVSSTLRYFAYSSWIDRGFFLFNRSQPITLDFLTGTLRRGNLRFTFTFSADEEYMIIAYESEIFHFHLITGKHRVISLQKTGAVKSQRYLYREFVFFNSDFHLVGYEGYWPGDVRRPGCYMWDASSGELLHSFLLDYPDTQLHTFIPSFQYLITSTSICTRVFEMVPEENWIRFSSNQQHSLRSLPRESSATLQSNGWVTTQNGELLFWVPQDYHERLHLPGMKYAIDMKLTELDLSSFEHGESWTSCKDDSDSNV